MITEGSCSVKECEQIKAELRVFGFPKEEDLRKKWIQNCGFDEKTFNYNNTFLCDKHFEQQCFGRYRLLLGSVPTLNLGTHEIVHSCITPSRPKKCSVCHISKRTHVSTRFFTFPTKKETANLWIKACKFDDNCNIRNKFICEHHFEPHFLGTRYMPKDAVPSLNLINDPLGISKNKQIKSGPNSDHKSSYISQCEFRKEKETSVTLENTYSAQPVQDLMEVNIKTEYEIDDMGEQIEQLKINRPEEATIRALPGKVNKIINITNYIVLISYFCTFLIHYLCTACLLQSFIYIHT